MPKSKEIESSMESWAILAKELLFHSASSDMDRPPRFDLSGCYLDATRVDVGHERVLLEVTNLGIGGIGFEASLKLIVGEKLIVIAMLPGIMPTELKFKVVWCQETSLGSEGGAKLIG